MKLYIVIETADIEIIGLEVFGDLGKAVGHYEKCRDENQEVDHEDMSNELSGTLRQAGDDAYAVQLVEREVP